MRLANGHGKGVGCVRRQRMGRPQQGRHHRLDLLFCGPAVPHDGLLHLQGAVLLNLQPRFRSGENGDPAGLAEKHGGLYVFREKRALHGHALGGVSFDLLGKGLKYALEAEGKGGRRGMDDAAVHIMKGTIRSDFYDSVACGREARINADDPGLSPRERTPIRSRERARSVRH
jgi:hypothetical protein